MTSLTRRMRRIVMLHQRRSMPLLLVVAFTFCFLGVGSVPSGASDWAIPSGPLPEPPPVGEPFCAYCKGSGCSECQPVVDDDSYTYVDPDPQPTYQPSGQGTTSAPPAQPPAPAVDPQQLFERHREALLREFRMPAGLADDSALLAVADPLLPVEEAFGSGPPPTGLLPSEWQEAAECQQALDALYAKWPLNSEDMVEVGRLEARRNSLWKKAVSVPGLAADERDRLRLKLHTLNPPPGVSIVTVSKGSVDNWLKPPSLSESHSQSVQTANPVGSWLVGQFATGQVQGALEFTGEVWADQIMEEHSFGDFLGAGKIALAYKDGGASSALAETANYLLGKIRIPQAGIAVEGGRQYANIVFQAQNKFMTDAMKAAGGEFDKEKFWSEFNADLNVWQRAVKEWIGYGKE